MKNRLSAYRYLNRITPLFFIVCWTALSVAVMAQAPLKGPVTPTGKTPPAKGWATQTVIDGLQHPWSVAFLPTHPGKLGDMLITEKPGYLRAVRDGRLLPKPVAGMPKILAIGQGGLMDVVLDPNFKRNRRIYFTYSAGTNRANYTALDRAVISDDLTRVTNVTRLFQVSQPKPGGQHFGSRLLFLPDGSLLMSIGDGGNPPASVDGKLTRHYVQELDSHFGKILRMDQDGNPLRNNPFIRNRKADPRLYALGLRNVQGMTIQPGTNDVYVTDHGARGGDEMNKIEAGKNYGWPDATYSYEYRGPRISQHTALPGMVDPLVVWTPALAPSGLAFYTGDKMPQWQGDLFAGGLVRRQIRRIDFENNQPTGQEQTLQFDDRIRDVRQGPDGYLYVLTDARDGRLLRIVPEQ